MQHRHRYAACALLLLPLLLTACDEPDHLALAEEAYRARDCAAALSHLDAALEEGSKNSNLYLFRGMVRSFCLGEFAKGLHGQRRFGKVKEMRSKQLEDLVDLLPGIVP